MLAVRERRLRERAAEAQRSWQVHRKQLSPFLPMPKVRLLMLAPRVPAATLACQQVSAPYDFRSARTAEAWLPSQVDQLFACPMTRTSSASGWPFFRGVRIARRFTSWIPHCCTSRRHAYVRFGLTRL